MAVDGRTYVMSSGGFGQFLSVTTAFIAAPLAPVCLSMPTEFIINRSIINLEPIGWICIVFGYLTMLFFGLPMYLSSGKTIPELTLILKLGTYLGALIPMLINIPLVLFFSLDETWLNDVQDILAYLVGGALYGVVSGLAFWVLAYSWRAEEPKKD